MNFQQIRDFVNPAVGQATGIEPVENLAMPVPTAHLMQAGGGGSITVDSELSEISTNPVENRVITAALNNLGQDRFIRVEIVNSSSGDHLNKTYTEITSLIWNSNKQLLLFNASRLFVCSSIAGVDADGPYAVFVAHPELPSLTTALLPVFLLDKDDKLRFQMFKFDIQTTT